MLSIVAGPQTLGWPVRRPRCFGCGLNRATLAWTGPPQAQIQKNFDSFFAAAVEVSADCFLVASPEEVLQEQRRLASNRGITLPPQALGSSVKREHLYAPGQLLRWKDYEKLRSEAPGSPQSWFADLEQSPQAGASTPGVVMPCMLTHGTIHAWSVDRPVTGLELYLAHGWNVYPEKTGQQLGCQITSDLRKLRVSCQKTLLGNGWHLPSISAWILYCVAHTVRTCSVQPGRNFLIRGGTMSSTDLQAAEQGCEGDGPASASGVGAPGSRPRSAADATDRVKRARH